MAEMYFYPSLFLNVRLGYNAFINSNIEFEKKNDEEQEIAHLNTPYEFDHHKNKEAIFFNGSKFYGEARIGLYLSKSQKRRPRQGYYITAGYQVKPRTTYDFGTKHALYKFSDNNFHRVPMVDENDSKYRSEWILSFGIAM